ncbi:MAG: aromatic-ring-hydroxylating dioxygenase subunit beta [Porticoccaceae bacterium]|jgi:p-cumate 2,3-dioxygenase beta subunit|nr:aromatic-ring-hydroxylating dioxygenase subunit beta [Porticoccaceae bacterium]
MSEQATRTSGYMQQDQQLRQEIESYLFYDAQLLDEWRLEEWSEHFCEDARYMVPALDNPDGDYHDSLFLISDDYLTLMSRVSQLKGRNAWVENPLSKTRRLITNVQASEDSDKRIHVRANFAIWRFHQGLSLTYVGRYEHTLARVDNGLKFKVRKSILDMETLRPHGRISIIL